MTETNTTQQHPRGVLSDKSEDRVESIIGSLGLEDLARAGFVIVHPDDVPIQTELGPGFTSPVARGWNACRANIFGDDT